MCVGLSILLFYMYGSVLSYFGLKDAYNTSIQNAQERDPDKNYYPLPALNIPIDVVTDDDTIQGVLSVLMILSLAEMFVGAWIVMLEKDQMMIGIQQLQVMVRGYIVSLFFELDTITVFIISIIVLSL